jgi:hypothetical protein
MSNFVGYGVKGLVAGAKALKNVFKPQKVSKDITSVPPAVAKTKKEKLLSQLNIKKQQVRGASARLKQTQFENKNPNFKGKDFTFATRVGRSSKVRENLKLGTKKKSNIEKIKKTFGANKKTLGMQSVIYGLDKNPNITKADPKAKFIAAANKKKKNKKVI